MSKEELLKHIELYKKTEGDVTRLDSDFGIRVWDSDKPNFYNNYNLLIHNLLVDIFDDEKVDLIEEFIFEQIDISFDELWDSINNK